MVEGSGEDSDRLRDVGARGHRRRSDRIQAGDFPMHVDGHVTLNAVAVRAGVSIATASRVLNGHPHVLPSTRELVLQAAREPNYHADSRARGLALQRTGTIGFVLSNVGDPFFAEMFGGVED